MQPGTVKNYSGEPELLKVKLLDPRAKAPTVGHPGEDLGFDLYALDDIDIANNRPEKIRTGIACYFEPRGHYGLVIHDRSSMASKGLFVAGGVIDAGYRNEIVVVMNCIHNFPVSIKAGDKIAQMIPVPVRTGVNIEIVDDLAEGKRGLAGFGSTGR
jgi:dUTP pyrophosphatase